MSVDFRAMIKAAATVSMKKVDQYYIGNCDLEVNLLNMHLVFIPPVEGERYCEMAFMRDFPEGKFPPDSPVLYLGKCDIDVSVLDTVIKFFPPRDAQVFGAVSSNTVKDKPRRRDEEEEDSYNKIWNPAELKVFMRRIEAGGEQAAA